MARPIEGIFFDLGDTLLDFGPVDVRGLFEAGAHLAYGYLRKLEQPLPSFEKFHRKQLWAIRWSYFKSRITRREFNSLDVLGRMSDNMGHDLTETQAEELAWLWYLPLRRTATVEPGTAEMLRRFHEQGLKLGLISNTFVPGQVLDRHLSEDGLLDLFPWRVYSCDVRYRKPNRKIFRTALKWANLRPHQTMFVGDSLQADVRGANRSGMISVLKDPSGHRSRSSATPRHRIRRLTELEELVSGYNESAGQ
ncbi:MAG: HAD family hydrolase [Phycisphaerae bacterium]